MLGLAWIDLAVLVAYLVGTTAVGVWLARRIRNASDFFMPRRYGKLMLLMFSFGAGTSSDQAVVVAAKSFRSGLAGIWYQWLWLLPTPFYWIIAVILRRSRAITVADMVESRFNRSFALLYTCLAVIHLTVQMGVMLKGSGAVVTATCGDLIDPNVAMLVITALFLFYGISGGLAAAIVTDFFQGLLTILFSLILLPYVFSAVGGFSGLRTAVDRPEMFSLANQEFTLFYILMISLNALIGIVIYPNMMGVCGASKSEYDSRFGLMSGNFLKRICTMLWCLTGLAAAGYYLDRPDVDADHIWGMLARDFLPGALPGMLGLFLSGVLASVMSTCDSMMINCAALFTENFYKPLVPGKSERHYVWVGRITSAVMVAGGLLFAYKVDNVVRGIEILWCIVPAAGMVFWIGLIWRGATSAGAWAGSLVGFAVYLLSSRPEFAAWLHTLPLTQRWSVIAESAGGIDGASEVAYTISLPWQMLLYLACSAVICIIVSLVTRKVDPERLDRFYELMRTPVQSGEQLTESCRLPKGVQPAPRRNLIPCKSIELPIPSRTTVWGVLVGWAVVFAMIGSFYWLTQA